MKKKLPVGAFCFAAFMVQPQKEMVCAFRQLFAKKCKNVRTLTKFRIKSGLYHLLCLNLKCGIIAAKQFSPSHDAFNLREKEYRL